MAHQGNPVYRFDDFTLEVSEHRLKRADQEVSLQPKTFEMLLYLVERHGHLVKKDEMLDALWPDMIVTESALNQCIREVRKALEDDAEHPRYIQTIHRVGYKFIAEVEELTAAEREEDAEEEEYTAVRLVVTEEGQESEEPIENQGSRIEARSLPSSLLSPPSSTPWWRPGRMVLAASVALFGLALTVYYLWPRPPAPPTPVKSIEGLLLNLKGKSNCKPL
jgi:DNA-binding winged helix-turn-helix (wHTH) protein